MGSAGTYWTIVATAAVAGCSLGFLNDPIGRPRFFGAAALGHSIFNYEGFFCGKASSLELDPSEPQWQTEQ